MPEKPLYKQIEENLEFYAVAYPFNSRYWRQKLELTTKLYHHADESAKQEVGYLKTKPNRNDSGLVVIYQPRLWTDRSLQKRGWNLDRIFFFRKTTEDENLMLRDSYRYRAWRVKKLEEFIEDERSHLDTETYQKFFAAAAREFDLSG